MHIVGDPAGLSYRRREAGTGVLEQSAPHSILITDDGEACAHRFKVRAGRVALDVAAYEQVESAGDLHKLRVGHSVVYLYARSRRRFAHLSRQTSLPIAVHLDVYPPSLALQPDLYRVKRAIQGLVAARIEQF